jgi:hypothetical protein
MTSLNVGNLVGSLVMDTSKWTSGVNTGVSEMQRLNASTTASAGNIEATAAR